MITSSGAKKLLKKRKEYSPLPIVLRDDFPDQNAFILDTNRYIAAQCSRRSGKSNGLAIRFFKTMEKHPKTNCLYLSLTHKSARDIMWPVLQELNDIHKLKCKFVESKLTMTHPNGSTLQLMGADLKDFIKRLKGRKFPGVAIDEAQDFGSHLMSLMNDVVIPSISDYTDGWLALTGTPGPVPQGVFFEITQQNKFGFSVHKWDMTKNPFQPNPKAFIADLKIKWGWDDNNPTLLREYKNNWILDAKSLWITYKDSINHYTELPKLEGASKYHYIVGVDLGYRDADAIAVIAWHESTPVTYLVEEIITTKQGITELTKQIEDVMKRYNPDKIVMGEGALGKKIGEEMRRQKGIPVHGAEKTLKQQNVGFLNDALLTGRLKAKGASRFAQDSYLVQIDWDRTTPDKIVIKKNPHSDIIDSVLYAFRECPAFSYMAPVPKPRYGSESWALAQQDDMFQAELEGLTKENEWLKWERGED